MWKIYRISVYYIMFFETRFCSVGVRSTIVSTLSCFGDFTKYYVVDESWSMVNYARCVSRLSCKIIYATGRINVYSICLYGQVKHVRIHKNSKNSRINYYYFFVFLSRTDKSFLWLDVDLSDVKKKKTKNRLTIFFFF